MLFDWVNVKLGGSRWADERPHSTPSGQNAAGNGPLTRVEMLIGQEHSSPVELHEIDGADDDREGQTLSTPFRA